MIYFVKAGRRVKVGYTDNVPRRLAQLQTGSSELLTLLGTIPGNRRAEQVLHDILDEYRAQGEWFEYRGKCRQFVMVLLAGAVPYEDVDVELLWEFATGPHRVEGAKAVIADPESTPDEMRDAHILLRDLTR